MALIDNELWSRIHSKDESIAELYDNFSSAMFFSSYQILNNQWESEEVIQDIFSCIWRKPEAFSQKGKFSSWLLVLTRNRINDRYRSRKRRGYILLNLMKFFYRDDPTQIDSADQAVKSDEFSNLREAFSRIPPRSTKVWSFPTSKE